jgi:NAD(P)-dependent dehydrogenase (short-subunit alcohol dehydrogenase family)
VRLTNKVALVTGSTSGIGRATAEAFARHGASVVVSGRDLARGEAVVDGIVASGGTTVFIPADLDSMQGVSDLAEASQKAFGQIDILVNNAGRYSFSSLSEMTEDTFDSMLGLNLKAPFFLTRALAAPMLERGRGKVINVTTMVSHFGHPAAAVYGASKAALGLLTKAWAVELGPSGVNVNAICPGAIRTPGTEFMGPALDEFGSTLPAGFVGAPSDVANAAVYLASDEADYIHGAMIAVDGGRLAA